VEAERMLRTSLRETGADIDISLGIRGIDDYSSAVQGAKDN
jgi:hypothetical protein